MKPWEKYAATPTGPWNKYQEAEEPPVPVDAIEGLTGPAPKAATRLADTIEDPNSRRGVLAAREREQARLPGERGAGEAQAPEATIANSLKGLGITTIEAWKQAGAGVRMQFQDAFGAGIDDWVERNMPNAPGQSLAEQRASGGTTAERDYARADGRMQDATPAFKSDFWEAVYGGGQSLLQTAPGIAAGIVGGPAAGLAVLGGQTESQSYGKYRTRGATAGEAALGGVGEGAVEVGTELLPMGFLVSRFGKAGAGEFITGLLARELPTEEVATFAQDAIDTAIANPNKSWEDFWKERPDAAYKTAIATVVQAGVMGGVEAIAKKAHDAEPGRPSDRSINASAIEAHSPDGKLDVPLTRGDIESPLDTSLIQAGKNIAADALGVDRTPKPEDRPAPRAKRAMPPVTAPFDKMVQITLGSESRNRDLDANGNVLTSPAGAKGKMQVMDGTNLDPGYGVRPAKDDSLAERARVGRDYLAAMMREYGGDPAKAWAAYNAGPGALNNAIEEHGANWLDHMPAETRKYVMKNLGQMGGEAFSPETGELTTLPVPDVEAVDMESADDFVKRVLGDDFFETGSATPAEAAPEAPAVAAPVDDIRGPAVDSEWTSFNPDTSGTLNIPRGEMPQVKAEHRGALANYLKGRGIASSEVTVPASSLKPTQTEFSEAKVAKARDFKGGDRAILISSDGYIVDGHHQWLAKRDAGEPVRAIQLQAPIAEVLDAVHDFPSSETTDPTAPAAAAPWTRYQPTPEEQAEIDAAPVVEKRTRAYRDQSQDTETDLATFIGNNGGLRDDEGHNLKGLRNLQRPIPGRGSLIRKDGKSVDMMRERLVEAGWLPEDATVADALELIDRANFRPIYHPQSDKFIAAQTASLEPEGEARSRIAGVVQKLGLETFGEKEMSYALEESGAGADAESAIWSAMDRALSEDPTLYGDPTPTEENYVPGFDPERDARETGSEQAPGRAAEGDQQSGPVEGTPGEGEGATARRGPSNATLKETSTGKGVILSGATDAEIEAIQKALPANVGKPLRSKSGDVSYSKKHEAKIREALDGSKTDETVMEESSKTVKVYRSGDGANGGWFTTSKSYAEQLAARDSTPVWEGEISRSDSLFDDAESNDPDLKLTYQRDFAPGEVSNTKKIAEAPAPKATEPVTPVETTAETAPTKAENPKQFSGNTVFTADKVEAARARLKAKLSGTTINSGVDPELLVDGMTIAGAYIESGVRRFADVSRALANDLGLSMAQIKPYLRAWYNGARDALEDSGADVTDMDGPGAVRAALTMIEDTETRAEAPAAVEPSQGTADTATDGDTAIRAQLTKAFADALGAGRAFATITEARAFAAETIGRKIESGTSDAKMLDEAIEAGVIAAARKIAVRNENNAQAGYAGLVDLYGRQPKLSVRTSTSIEQQAYSTPVPLAFLASRLAGINQNTTVYEPSAGNGSLLIDARPTYVTANELNADRADQLRAFLPGGTVTENDATEYVPAEQVDAVIANPPFGPLKNDTGATIRFDVDDRYSTNEIDHAIALKALQAMKDGGKATLIIGGVNKLVTDPKKRSDAYNGKAKREFFFTLYSQYNVTDHFTVDGSLYERQGAGWPVDVIVIDGRGKSSLPLPAVKVPRQYASWDALSEVLNNDGRSQTTRPVRPTDAKPAGQTAAAASPDVGNTGKRGSGGVDRRAGVNPNGKPAGVRNGSADGQSDSLRVDAERPPVAEAAGDQQPRGTDGLDAPRVAPEVAENDKQVTYTPGSDGNAMGTLVPVNMQNAVAEALANLTERRDQIDGYVSDRLGYNTKELHDRFGAEQVDAIALALDNIERGAGFIIGDQTGIGKGRVVAAVIRYAIRQKLTPIFVTEKPNLYADMYRDLTDIGMKEMLGRDIGIAMTNSGQSIPLDEEGKQTLRSAASEKHKEFLQRLSRNGLASEGMDVLFTTYSQMQTVQGKETERQAVLRRLAAGGVLILDESHNAGGTGPEMMKAKDAPPNRAEFVRELVNLSKGVFYSSATYAKRPDVMDLYAATDMRLAVDDLSRLGEAIAKGGVPMQQVVAAMLSRAGQYIRRERSFDGIAYNTPTVEIDRGQYSDASTVLKSIQDFSENYVSSATETLNEELKADAERVGTDNATGEVGASSTNFTSIMHNVIDQMLLAFKADAAADRVIDSIKRGEKPVVTVANTLEAFLSEYANDAGVGVGEKLDITFADVFRRYLERSRIVTVKKPFMKKGEEAERVRLTDAQLGPAGTAAFREAMEIIGQSDLDKLPGSPLDHIIGRVQDAGYKVAEVTGRTLGLDYREGGPVLKARGSDVRSVRGRINAIRGFNDGSIDAILLNRSGSTGLSLHASEKFKDKRKRRMIIAQAEGNIDTHMQMLGRVHRTGQVVLPEYDQLVGGVPAEKRPAAVLAKKMASLNANTTASRDSALTSKEVLDFMNEYGDLVASRLMQEEPDIHEALGHPLKLDSESYTPEGAARRVTGRIPLLPVDLQEEVYKRIEDEYAALLAQKEASGENALEAKTYDYQAITEATEEAVAPVPGSTSPFADGVYVERTSVKRLGKPFPTSQVLASVAQNLDEDVPAGEPLVSLAALVSQTSERQSREINTMYAQGAQYIRDMESGVKVKKAGKKEEEKLDSKALTALKEDAAKWRQIRDKARIGAGIRLKTDAGNLYGIVTDIYRGGKSKNPLALGSWRVEVALVDAARSITLPFSQVAFDNGGASIPDKIMFDMQSKIADMPIIEAFDIMQSESRETRSIATGNLLKAFDYVNGQGAIINYTTDAGTVKQGILLKRAFDLKKHQAEQPVALVTPKIVIEYLAQAGGNLLGQGKSGAISAMAVPTRNTFMLTAAKSKSAGGEFFQNKALIAAMGEQFVSKSNGMVSTSSMSRAEDAIKVLLESGVKFEVAASAAPEAKEQARAIIERYAPPPVERRQVVDAKAAVSRPTEAEVSKSSPETFANWKKSVDSVGTVMGWTIFNDEVGGSIVLMNQDQRVGPFSSERDARAWAQQESKARTSLAPETAQPERTMTQQQRGELDARQQQGMARRGGQASIKDQDGGLFGSDRDQDSMFSRTDQGEAVPQDFSAVADRLFDRIKALGLGDKVMLNVVDNLFNDSTVAGSYQAGVIRVSLATSQSPDYTFDHEVIHALRDLGLFRPAEWTALSKAATADKKIMDRVTDLYPDLSPERQTEEAISEMFATWREGRRSQSGFVRQAFQRMLDLFSTIRRAITGGNLRDEVESILRAIDAGEIGPRDPDGPGGGGGARESRLGDAALNLVGNRENVTERLDQWRTNLQDRMLPLLRTQQRVELQSGRALDESANPYLAEELMTGKVGSRLEKLTDDMVGPMFEQIKAEGLTVDEVEQYLYARHAAERNARISSINSEFGEGTGSGMTDAEATAILERADVEEKIPGLERVAEKVDAILKFAMDTRVEAGLLSEEEADAWRAQYQFYVPLRGKAEIEPEGGEADRPRFGSGINVRGKESKMAFGRQSRAADILAYSIMQAEEAVARAGRNEVAQAFYNMVKANPDADFWKIQKVTRKPVFNKTTGTVSYRNDTNIQPEDQDYTVSLKIDGKERRVTMNKDNPKAVALAKAMRNLNGSELGSVLQVMSRVNRFLSTVNTGLNPEFVITNAFRDIQTAGVNLAQFDQKGLIGGTLKDYRKALVASTKGAFKSESGEWGKWYREFVDEGGRIYFNQVDDLNDVRNRISKQFAKKSGLASQASMNALGGLKAAFEYVGKVNTGVENAIRLSAYKNARERGMSKAEAASLAKNLTVNFNRRGGWGTTINSMYLFYNASVQGSMRLFQAAFAKGKGGRNVRRILMGAVTVGFLLDVLNTMLTGYDDDGESYYDKISDFDKARNLIIMNPDGSGDYFKIPLPYGYNVFYTMGRTAGEIGRGRRWQESAGSLASTIIDAFNPVGGTSNILNLIAPTIVDPAVDLVRNRDFADRPIMPEDSKFGPETPDSSKYWGSVSPMWRAVTTALNSGTGGDEVLPGAIDVSPETMEYMSGVVTGAAGAFVMRNLDLGTKLWTGDDIDKNDWPMARKVLGEKPTWYDKAAFYARSADIKQAASAPKEYRERGMDEKADQFEDQNSAVLSLMPDVKRADKAMRALRKERAALDIQRGRDEIDSAEYKSSMDDIKAREKEVVTEFNTEYLATVEKPVRP